MRHVLAQMTRAIAPRQRPVIGVTGSFGRGNYGDELYVRTYEHWFGGWADLRLLTGLHKANQRGPARRWVDQVDARWRVDQVDAVVLGGGDLLCPSKDWVDPDFVNPLYLRRPVHIAGIGVQRNRPTILPHVLETWQGFLRHENIRSITMRDPGSAEWVRTHIAPQVEVGVTPDLVCALPLPEARRPQGKPILGLVTRHIQNPKNYRMMTEVGRHLMAQGWRVRHVIGGVGPHGRKDLENANQLELPGKETFHCEDLDEISRALGECSLVLSMKLHTTLVAAMYGVPTISMNPVVKARAFMAALGREDCVFTPNNKAVLRLIEAGVPAPSPEARAQLRDGASDYLRGLGQQIWEEFRASTGATLPAHPPFPD